MGQNNRRRRADKQRRRDREQRRTRPPAGESGADSSTTRALQLFVGLVRAATEGVPGYADRAGFAAVPIHHQIVAIEAEFDFVIGHLLDSGWTPLDFAELGKRKASEAASAHLLAVVAEHTDRHPAALVDPRWRTELEQRPTSPPLSVWCTTRQWHDFVDQLVVLLGALCVLPRIETVLPRPGTEPAATVGSHGIDEKVLRRVRALLAKAESTDFEAEAEALSAKAQELMTQYSIEHALAADPHDRAPVPSVRRIWLDAPYVLPKALLVAEVGSANHTRAVISEHLGFVTIMGFDTDLDVVELLVTSLLLQATRALRLAPVPPTREGTSRTRSFRQSFLSAYAQRIGERLREAAEQTAVDADTAHGGALLPVLATRERIVDDAFETTFPQLVQRGVRVSNAAGYGAGRAAADLAQLDIRDAVSG